MRKQFAAGALLLATIGVGSMVSKNDVVGTARIHENDREFFPAGAAVRCVGDDRASAGKPLTLTSELRLHGENGVKGLLNFSPDGNTLMVVRLRTVHLWDLSGAAPREASTMKEHDLGIGDIIAAAISPDGKRVALGGYDKGVHLYSLENMRLAQLANQQEHDGPVFSLQFSPDGRTLASGGDDMAVYFWDVANGQLQERAMFKVEDAMFGVQNLAFAPDGKSLFLDTGTGDVRGIELVGDQPTQRIAWKVPATLALPMALSPDGKILAFGSRQDLRLSNGADSTTCHGHTGQINCVAWSADGREVASAGEDGRLMVWDSSGHLRYSVQRPSPFDWVAFRPSGKNRGTTGMWLAAANRNGTVYVLNLVDASTPAAKAAPETVAPL